MELIDAITRRRSVRDFTEKEVDTDTLIKILNYANLAPSAGNLQARDFIIVKDKDIRYALSEAALGQHFVAEAPANIVVCANLKRISPYGSRGRNLYCIQDTAAATDHILLLALEYGLSTCWVGAFSESEVSEILDLPSYIRPVAIVPIGYPRSIPKSPPRRDIKEMIHFDSW